MITVRCKMKNGADAEVKHLDMGAVPEGFGKTIEYLSLFRINGKFVASVYETSVHRDTTQGRETLDMAILDAAAVDVDSFMTALQDAV